MADWSPLSCDILRETPILPVVSRPQLCFATIRSVFVRHRPAGYCDAGKILWTPGIAEHIVAIFAKVIPLCEAPCIDVRQATPHHRLVQGSARRSKLEHVLLVDIREDGMYDIEVEIKEMHDSVLVL